MCEMRCLCNFYFPSFQIPLRAASEAESASGSTPKDSADKIDSHKTTTGYDRLLVLHVYLVIGPGTLILVFSADFLFESVPCSDYPTRTPRKRLCRRYCRSSMTFRCRVYISFISISDYFVFVWSAPSSVSVCFFSFCLISCHLSLSSLSDSDRSSARLSCALQSVHWRDTAPVEELTMRLMGLIAEVPSPSDPPF